MRSFGIGPSQKDMLHVQMDDLNQWCVFISDQITTIDTGEGL
jgi:hypothetical protein